MTVSSYSSVALSLARKLCLLLIVAVLALAATIALGAAVPGNTPILPGEDLALAHGGDNGDNGDNGKDDNGDNEDNGDKH